MFGLTALDFAIALSFVYLLLSLICTTVHEWIAGLLEWRGKTLEEGIRTLLTGESTGAMGSSAIVERFYNHPLVRSLRRDKRLPSYIGAETFAKVLLSLRPPADRSEELPSHLKATFESLGVSASAESAPPGTSASAKDPAAAPPEETILAGWFNGTMDRVTGWYRRRSQGLMAVLAVVVTVALNADTIQMSKKLWTNPALREQLVAEAKVCVEKAGPAAADFEYKNPDNPDPDPPTVRKLRESCADPAKTEQLLGELFGWDADLKTLAEAWKKSPDVFGALWSWLGGVLGMHLVGWLLTAIAISQGAHFWFDGLKRLVNLRSSGNKRESEEGAAK